MIKFILNNTSIETSLPSGMTMLDFVRKQQQLTGTKIGCREGDCGACTILVGKIENDKMVYQNMTSCLFPLINAAGKHIVTVEGINGKNLTPVQAALVENGGTQCGFCTIGFVMSLTGFALSDKKEATAVTSIDGNICRCTGYKSIERAAADIAAKIEQKPSQYKMNWLVEHEFIPTYFLDIKNRLASIQNDTHKNKSLKNFTFIGGGTDLYVQQPAAMVDKEIIPLFDKKTTPEIHLKNGNCYLDASTTVTEIEQSEAMLSIFPNLVQYMSLISSTPIRNMATIAGNFVNASPIGDMTIFFLALDASIVLRDKKKQRTIKLKDFYKGYKQLDKSPNEHIETVFFEVPYGNYYFNFEKVSKRTHLDIASVNTACLLHIDEQNIITKAHLSAGGLAAIPTYLSKTATFLQGKPAKMTTFKQVVDILQSEVSPISDVRGTKEYKRLLLRQLFYAHIVDYTSE